MRVDSGPEELVYDSVTDTSFPNSATDGVFTNLENIRRTIGRGFPEGTHNFKLEVEDRAGNISEDYFLDVTVDTTLTTPADGIVLDLISIADTGMDNSDNVTKINTPTFAGIAEVGSEVSLFADDILVGTATVGSDETDSSPGDGMGAWEVSSAALVDGQHEMVVHIEDWAGNAGQSDPLTIDIDTTAPNTPFLGIDGGQSAGLGVVVSIVDNLTLTMTTEDPDIDSRISPFNYKYRIYQRTGDSAESLVYNSATDSNIADENRRNGFTDLTFLETALADLPEGQHNFKLEVEDRAGNISHDFLLSVVRTTPDPLDAISIDLLSASDTGMSENDNVTNKDRPGFTGIATIGTKVRLISVTDAGEETIGRATVSGDASNGQLADGLGVWEIAADPLDDGVYNVVAEVEDDFGNTVRTDVLQIEVDTIAPNTPQLDLLPADDSGASDQDNVTSEVLPSFNMATLDSNKDLHLSPFNFKYRLFVRLDSGAEQLVYDSSTDGSFPASAIEDGLVNLENVRREIDLGVPDGVHNFKLEVEDRAGNISTDRLLNVTIDTTLDAPMGTNGPTVDIDMVAGSDSGMSDRDNVTRISNPTFTGRAEVGAVVTLFANGQVVGTGVIGSDETDFVPGDGLGVWEITVDTLDDGRYEVLAHVEDLAGNFLRSSTVPIEVDTTQPNTPYLDLLNDTGHANYDDITGENVLDFNLTTTDPDLPDGADRASDFNLKYRIYLRPEGGEEELIFNSVTDTSIDPESVLEGFTNLNTLQATLGPFDDGIHNFKLEVEDRAGNVSEDFLLTVQIDSDLAGDPGIDMLMASDSGMDDGDNVTGIDQPAFTGVGEVGSTVRLLANGELVGVGEVQSDDSDGVPGDGLGQWEITSEPLDDGVYNISADIEDWAGNVESTGALQIEVDTLAPNTPQLDLLPANDTGLSDQDNVTSDLLPTFNMATIDPNQDDHLIGFNYKYRLFNRLDSGVELLVYDSASDTSFPGSVFQNGFTSLENLRRSIALAVPDGVHNFKLEVEDRAGNISTDTVLDVTIDTMLDTANPNAPAVDINLLDGSDSGMDARDNVTKISNPTFSGRGEVGAMVTLFANGEVVGTGIVGSDETDFVPGDGLGSWEVTVDDLDDGQYDVLAHVEDLAGNFLRSDVLPVEIDSTQPNTPYLDLLNDTGHAHYDNITGDSELNFNLTTSDPSLPDGSDRASEFNLKYRIYLRPDAGEERLVYNSVIDPAIDPANMSEGFTNLNQLQTTLGPFDDGIHNFKLEVEDPSGQYQRRFPTHRGDRQRSGG